MPSLDISIQGPQHVIVTAQPLEASAFAPFGEVIKNPRPDVHPSRFADAGPLPFEAVSANQGSAIKYQHVTRMVNRYHQAPSGTPGVAVMNMFVCAARKLQKHRPGRSASASPSSSSSSSFFQVDILERHPYTTQTFSPLGTTGPGNSSTSHGYLVIVAPTLEPPGRKPSSDGSAAPAPGSHVSYGPSEVLRTRDPPDLTRLKAFVATIDQAVTYGAGTWHAPMVALGPEGSTVDFVVTQFANGVGDEDCQEVTFRSSEDGSVWVELSLASTTVGSRL